jgi:hypothetical protein
MYVSVLAGGHAWSRSQTARGSDQCVGDSCGGLLHRSRLAGEDYPPQFARLAADGEDSDAVGKSLETYRGDRRDRQPGGDDAEFREPVAHYVAHVGAMSEAGPNAEQRVAGVGVAGGLAVARVEGRVLNVRDPDSIASLAAEFGAIDIVFSNASSRMSPAADPTDEVDAVAETSNLATTRILQAFAPRLRPGGRLIIVASALGTLDKLDDRIAGRFADVAKQDLDAVDALVSGPLASGRSRWPRRRGGLRDLAEHPVEGRAGRRGAGVRPRPSRSGSRREQVDHGAVSGPDRHGRVAAVVRGHEQRADPGPSSVMGLSEGDLG